MHIAGNYPYLMGTGPDIDIDASLKFEVVGDNRIAVTLSGNHNAFPDYEAYIDGHEVYRRFSPDAGPGFKNVGIYSVDIPKTTVYIENIPTPSSCSCGLNGYV
jgi:hypothetical protein